MLLLATLDYAQVYFYESALRHALRESGRFATTGQIQPKRDSDGNIVQSNGTNELAISSYGSGVASRNESIREEFRRRCVLALNNEDINIYSWPGDNNATENNPNPGPGLAADFIKIQVRWPISLITPMSNLFWENGIFEVNITSIFRNEPGSSFRMYTNRYEGEQNAIAPQ